ncbi:hypothetical protein [Chitinophaga pinensis]|nr:hypothetical protein [Chitinophaga pinensis]
MFSSLKNSWNKSTYKRTADGDIQVSNTVLPAKEEIILVFKP